ncbi:hypothetical protein HNV11_16710 [Spirosoma taeanense]|uniref:Uncharacterized protein n=1 Tax=Spirosoma taeanense TaxID=2735870 RepID=A0A6M5YCD5_9BACT|nr:hypothetical protein [Spirosoma taeanense]QJW90901.1 hypothetical protein HNV11_16710 [Spirosoma taeanense]
MFNNLFKRVSGSYWRVYSFSVGYVIGRQFRLKTEDRYPLLDTYVRSNHTGCVAIR